MAQQYVNNFTGLNPNQRITNTADYFDVQDGTDQFGSGRINANKLTFASKPGGAGDVLSAYRLQNGALNQVDLSNDPFWQSHQAAQNAYSNYNNAQGKNAYMTGASDFGAFQNKLQNDWTAKYGGLVTGAGGTNWNSNLESQYGDYLKNNLMNSKNALISGLGADVVGQNVIGNYNSFINRADPNGGVNSVFQDGRYVGKDPNAPENNAAMKAQLEAMRNASVQAAANAPQSGPTSFTTNPTLTNEQARQQLLGEAAQIQAGQRVGDAYNVNPANQMMSPSAPKGFVVDQTNGKFNFAGGANPNPPQPGTDAYYGIPGFMQNNSQDASGNWVQNPATAQVQALGAGNTQSPTGAGAGSEASSGTSTEDDLMRQLMEIATNEAKLKQANRVGMANLSDQPIAQSFISGQQASLERRLANDLAATGMHAEPLRIQLANEQAKRAAALDATKFEETKRANKSEEDYRNAVLNKPVEVSKGAMMWDPATKKFVSVPGGGGSNTGTGTGSSTRTSNSTGNSVVDAWVNQISGGRASITNVPAALKNSVISALDQQGSGSAQTAQKANDIYRIASELLNDSSLSNAVGPISSRIPTVRGSTADFEAKVNTLKSLLTLDNIGLLKGVLSDSDMKLLTSAATSLGTGMSEDGFKSELQNIINKVGSIGNSVGIQDSERVTVTAPDGTVGEIPRSQLQEALNQGFKQR